jgi:hypothetical protein
MFAPRQKNGLALMSQASSGTAPDFAQLRCCLAAF